MPISELLSTTIVVAMKIIAYAVVMADEPKKNPILATGKTVAANVKRLREEQRLKFTDLAAILEGIGKPIPTLGLRHIEAEKRRVDTDDLVALAVALGVSPVTLLIPDSPEVESMVEMTGREESISAFDLWNWLTVAQPLRGDEDVLRFWRDSLPLFLRTRFIEALEKGQPVFPPPLQFMRRDPDGND